MFVPARAPLGMIRGESSFGGSHLLDHLLLTYEQFVVRIYAEGSQLLPDYRNGWKYCNKKCLHRPVQSKPTSAEGVAHLAVKKKPHNLSRKLGGFGERR